MTHRALLELWFRRVWNKRDAAAIDEMFVADGRARGLGEDPLIGPPEFRRFHAAMCALFSTIDITIDKCMDEGDWVTALCTMRATSASSGRPITMTGTVWIRIADGKLVEGHNHWDFLGMFRQLGFLPENTFATGLAGKRIA